VTHSESARATARRTRSPARSPFSAAPDRVGALGEAGRGVPGTGLTVYGCGQEEAALFRRLAPRFGVVPTITESGVSETNIELACGNRCISVGHQTRLTNSALRALSRAGVGYISTRSVGYDHIDVEYAASVGILVGNVAYSPDSVADYTLMLMLMALRNAKSMIRRVDMHDYRLPDARGKELRDLDVGVIGTGRIGAAVIARLRGFGCRIAAYDNHPGTRADYVPLDELLHLSDMVTLHLPLNADTHHLLNRRRIERMRHGALIVNTGRGALIDTVALVSALESGHLGGAALDVLEGEEGIFYADRRSKPVESGPLVRLQNLPNVTISPHTAYYTDHALSDIVENSITNCLEFESGEQHG
jgi:D-specific alpha-keto acid dehydrogenase